MEKELYIEQADEKFYVNTFENGLKCFVFPKSKFVEKQIMFAVNYGSVDNLFTVNKKFQKAPNGIAHFIEHKLFDQKDYNVFEKFSKYGASSNAFTNFNTTAYYFNCTDNVYKNTEILFDFVSKPFFTAENVKKEMDIISQEIKMYDDDPFWKIYFNLLKNMYFNHTVQNDIAGTVKSISDITSDMLYENYEKFYTYNNSVIVCAGNVEREKIYELIDKNIKLSKNKNKAEKVFFNEKNNVKNNFISEKMPVKRTLFNIGIKHTSNDISIKKIISLKLILDIVCGNTSDFYEYLYNKRVIDKSFSYAYTCGRDYGFSIISGFSENPEKVKDFFITSLTKFKNYGIDNELFEKVKNKYIGRFIMGFNSLDTIACTQIDFFTKGFDLFDYSETLKKIQLTDVENILADLLSENNIVLSLIVP